MLGQNSGSHRAREKKRLRGTILASLTQQIRLWQPIYSVNVGRAHRHSTVVLPQKRKVRKALQALSGDKTARKQTTKASRKALTIHGWTSSAGTCVPNEKRTTPRVDDCRMLANSCSAIGWQQRETSWPTGESAFGFASASPPMNLMRAEIGRGSSSRLHVLTKSNDVRRASVRMSVKFAP